MIYDGRNGGSVETLENVLVIRRKGIASALSQGLKGEKRIPYSSITSVQFKDPGITTGYIQFGILGGLEGRGGVFNATADENTVLFVKSALKEYRQLRDFVESRIGGSTQAASASKVQVPGFLEELGRLADLRDRGVLSDDEFAQEKLRLQYQRDRAAEQADVQPTVEDYPAEAGTQDSSGRAEISPESEEKKNRGKGCLIVIGLILALMVLGSILGTGNSSKGDSTDVQNFSEEKSVISIEEPIQKNDIQLTMNQRNAVRSAEGYLAISGFSRNGLIQQLSSEAGDSYSISDATTAVDSMNVNWKNNAQRSADQYLKLSGYSCRGLVEQLSSSAEDDYTLDQAKYGAQQAGVC